MHSKAFDETAIFAMERHEASVWAALVEATANVEGNRLKAEVDRSGLTPLPTVASLDSIHFNRVIAPEALVTNRDSELDRFFDFYSARSQTHFAVEIPPTMATEKIASGLSERGLADCGRRIAKTIRSTDINNRNEILTDVFDTDVFELGAGDRDAWIAVTTAAWGVPRMMRPWFGSSFQSSGFHHFGMAHDNDLVAVGATHVAGEFAWLGLDATHPKYRGRGMQLALLAHRVRAAADLGCRWAHSDTFLERGESTNASLRNMLRADFVRLYDRIIYERGDRAIEDGTGPH